MEELESLQERALASYLASNPEYIKEDLIVHAGLKVTSAIEAIMALVHSVRGTGKLPDLSTISRLLNSLITETTVIAYCIGAQLPLVETLIDFIDEEISSDLKMDVILSILNIQNIYSNMILEYFETELNAEELTEEDESLRDVGILEILATAMCIATRYKLTI